MERPELIFEGSVKNIRGLKGHSPYYFEYSDRFSVFDWGAMPDELEGKGRALANMAQFFFEYLGSSKNWRQWQIPEKLLNEVKSIPVYSELCERGLDHHCLGIVDEFGKEVNDRESANHLAVKAVNIVRPETTAQNSSQYDYSAYENKLIETLVPLEVVFRFGVPEGSSLIGRLDSEAYLNEIGLQEKPSVGDAFETPIIEFSTKLESTDRYINRETAKKIAGMSNLEFQRLYDLVFVLSLRLKEIFKDCGVTLWDGKFEFAFSSHLDGNGDRFFTLIDSIGPDELRLTYNGIQLSKETLRKYYRSSPWYKAVEKSKKLVEGRGRNDWKRVCLEELKMAPPVLDEDLKNAVSNMYLSLTNILYKRFEGKDIFKESWSLSDLVKKIEGKE